jgi:hypothetical protein
MSSVPGLNLPTQQGMLAGNPRDSAIASQTAATNKLTALNKAVGGRNRRSRKYTRKGRRHNSKFYYTRKLSHKRGRRRLKCSCPCSACRNGCLYARTSGHRHKRRGGAAAATVQVPQFTMQYAPTGGPGQTPNDLIKQNSQISTQTAANAVYDSYASKK